MDIDMQAKRPNPIDGRDFPRREVNTAGNETRRKCWCGKAGAACAKGIGNHRHRKLNGVRTGRRDPPMGTAARKVLFPCLRFI